MYLPVAIIGYTVKGSAVDSNILLDIPAGWPITLAIALGVLNLLITYVVDVNPVAQAVEDILGIEPSKSL